MLRRFLEGRRSRSLPQAPDGRRAYAIGDVHGRLDLLLQLLDKVEKDHRSRPPAKAYLIFLGDLVDRGPDSKGVIDHLIKHPPGFARTIFLKGNHEEFFLGALGGDLAMLQNWLVYGGAECAASYGVSQGWILNSAPPDILARLVREVPSAHLRFVEDMADTFKFGDYLFVHAGIRPGVELEAQVSKDLRWIREGFLEDRTDHGVIVVHGHTIVEDVEEHPNRIAIDTGAYRTGVLTALALEGTERRFIQVRAEA
jgi:serine/threonine protein phosphatase 1